MSAPATRADAPATLLIVDDVSANIGALSGALESAGHRVLAALSGAAALKAAAKARPDLILLDVLMPEMDGIETCKRLKADPTTADIPVVFVTANDEMQSLCAGFAAGGFDYITKPFQIDEVLARVATHLRVHRLTRELARRTGDLEKANAELRAEIRRREQAETELRLATEKLSLLTEAEARQWGLAGFVGRSPAFGQLLHGVRSVQAYPKTNVLLTGESGTGKELIARAIHFGSPQATGPFVAVNCSALPAELAESLLFGHMRGSFTGAVGDRKGYFELAHGGTLFLDEIGDMPLLLQAKLLRVLEDGNVTPVGASAGRKVQVRVVAATNVDVAARVASGGFRQDLYYRLMHFHVEVPPLRARREDVPLLASHFSKLFAADMKRPAPALRSDTVEKLLAHDYPGNIRELKNTIERAIIYAGDATELRPEHVVFAPQAMAGGLASTSTAGGAHPAGPGAGLGVNGATTRTDGDLPLNLAAAEEMLVTRALAATGHNISAAARLLGIDRTSLHRKLARKQGGADGAAPSDDPSAA